MLSDATIAAGQTIAIRLPCVLALDQHLMGNSIQQVAWAQPHPEAAVEEWPDGQRGWFTVLFDQNNGVRILVVTGKARYPDDFPMVLCQSGENPVSPQSHPSGELLDLSSASWVRHPRMADTSSSTLLDAEYQFRQERVIASWGYTAFSYAVENRNQGIPGLRPPQTGAVHSVHAHWATDSGHGTIIMPTGTGKTEAMLAVTVSRPCERVLVVVPTDALRKQISEKFLTLGLLKHARALSETALYPIVGVLRHRPRTIQEVDAIFEKCNVIVTTMQIAGQCGHPIQDRMAELCPYLFVDEAHHIGADTWRNFRRRFERRGGNNFILQFTATPFRNDDRPVDGDIIFNYPLKKAQLEGYYTPIRFDPVLEFNRKRADVAIAEKAIRQLREDLSKGYDHILMARVDSIERAHKVLAIYKQYSEFNPVEMHSNVRPPARREQVRQQIQSRQTRIVVCVDMLGEGFDMPELKIAAFHDVRKSLAVTLQLAGRFTRARTGLGNPTFVANIADIAVRDELRKLYSRDSDWNVLLPQSSSQAIQKVANLLELVEGFTDAPGAIPLQNLRPALSTAIYRTTCANWMPHRFRQGLDSNFRVPDVTAEPDDPEDGAKLALGTPPDGEVSPNGWQASLVQDEQAGDGQRMVYHAINPIRNVLVVVTAHKVPVDWAQMQDMSSWGWGLLVAYWDKHRDLLFINSSSNNGYYRRLAEAVAPGQVELLEGACVFRCFAGINRLRLQNVGLREEIGKLIRYVMRAGPNVEPGLTNANKNQATKLNIFGAGFEDGSRASIGCSYRGRIWSRRTGNLDELIRWCSTVGQKVLDTSIDPDKILEGTLVPEPIGERPKDKMPVCVEWPEEFYREAESVYGFQVVKGGETVDLELCNTELRLEDPSPDGPLRFAVCSDGPRIEFTLVLFEKNGIKDYLFDCVGDSSLLVTRGSRVLGQAEDFFVQYQPVIRFADGSSLEGNKYTRLVRRPDPYDRRKIVIWDWSGVNIRKESQGVTKRTDSVQRHVIQNLLDKGGYTIVFDDDSSGECADVVGITDRGESVLIELYHCKFSLKTKPGGRVDDLYIVCGQAQKAVNWAEDPQDLYSHLMRREPRRGSAGADPDADEEDSGTTPTRSDQIEVSRFEKGSPDDLATIISKSLLYDVNFHYYVVQPGLSLAEVSEKQLELLGVTENYLMETYKIPLTVIANS